MSEAIGLDTNVLARYYVQPAPDNAAEQLQCDLATSLIDSGQPLAVCKTVLLELEWVLRGYYRYDGASIRKVYGHLLSLPHVVVEDRPAVERALQSAAAGIDFADALHLASYAACAAMATFDDRQFARRSRKLGLLPTVKVPG